MRISDWSSDVCSSDLEKLELELAEEARIGADDWSGGVAPGKPARFGPSFRRLIGLLRPNAAAFIFVSFLGAIGVVLSVLAPRLLGDATNVLFEGVVSQMVPAGATQEQVVEGLRAKDRKSTRLNSSHYCAARM